jgi:Ca2+-binding RTX toxin-like protein
MNDKTIIWLSVRITALMFIVTATLWMNTNFACANEWHMSEIFKTSEFISNPSIAVDENNIAHIAWSDYSGLYYANSKNDWFPITIITSAYSSHGWYQDLSIFVDKTDSIYIAWVDYRNVSDDNDRYSGIDIYYASSHDGWVEHLVTAEQTASCYDPVIAVDNDGDVYITFRQNTSDSSLPYNRESQVFLAKKSTGWAEERISFTGNSNILSSDMDIDNSGVVHVVFSTAGNSPIWYANSANNWINTQIDSNVMLDRIYNVRFIRIDTDSKNTAHIVWMVNESQIYYANVNNNLITAEVALPTDTDGRNIKFCPSIFVQNDKVHAIWSQNELGAYYHVAQGNILYSNSSNWNNTVNITNFPDRPIPYDWSPGNNVSDASYDITYASNALSIDKNGIIHATWKLKDNTSFLHSIYYAKYSTLQSCDCADPRAIKGTSGQDFLYGTMHADIICGFGDQDFIVSLGGDDCIDGGEGDDWIFGGSGNDMLDGGEGYDWLFCGSGMDEGSGEYCTECEN